MPQLGIKCISKMLSIKILSCLGQGYPVTKKGSYQKTVFDFCSASLVGYIWQWRFACSSGLANCVWYNSNNRAGALPFKAQCNVTQGAGPQLALPLQQCQGQASILLLKRLHSLHGKGSAIWGWPWPNIDSPMAPELLGSLHHFFFPVISRYVGQRKRNGSNAVGQHTVLHPTNDW